MSLNSLAELKLWSYEFITFLDMLDFLNLEQEWEALFNIVCCMNTQKIEEKQKKNHLNSFALAI